MKISSSIYSIEDLKALIVCIIRPFFIRRPKKYIRNLYRELRSLPMHCAWEGREKFLSWSFLFAQIFLTEYLGKFANINQNCLHENSNKNSSSPIVARNKEDPFPPRALLSTRYSRSYMSNGNSHYGKVSFLKKLWNIYPPLHWIHHFILNTLKYKCAMIVTSRTGPRMLALAQT